GLRQLHPGQADPCLGLSVRSPEGWGLRRESLRDLVGGEPPHRLDMPVALDPPGETPGRGRFRPGHRSPPLSLERRSRASAKAFDTVVSSSCQLAANFSTPSSSSTWTTES